MSTPSLLPSSTLIRHVVSAVEQFVALQSSTAGRDKVAKVLQYGSRMLSHLIIITTTATATTTTATTAPQKDHLYSAASRLSRLEAGVGTGRKVMRLFRFLPGHIAFVRYVLKIVTTSSASSGVGGGKGKTGGGVLELVAALNKLFMAQYLLLDSLGWCARLSLLGEPYGGGVNNNNDGGGGGGVRGLLQRILPRDSRAAHYGKRAAQFWMLGVLCALVIDVHDIASLCKREAPLLRALHGTVERMAHETTTASSSQQQQQQQQGRHSGQEEEEEEGRAAAAVLDEVEQIERELHDVQARRRGRALDMAADLCDLGVALALTGAVNLDRGVVGALGTINGLIGVYKLWPRTV